VDILGPKTTNISMTNNSNLKKSKQQSIADAVKEGLALLAEESPTMPPVEPTATILPSKNPYLKARKQVLAGYPEWRRKEIAQMEASKNTEHRFYQDFVDAIIYQGNILSNS
jgi:hypothetical protein